MSYFCCVHNFSLCHGAIAFFDCRDLSAAQRSCGGVGARRGSRREAKVECGRDRSAFEGLRGVFVKT